MPGQERNKPSNTPESPPQSQPPTPEGAKEGIDKEKEKKEKDIHEKTKKKLGVLENLGLGGDFGLLMKDFFKTFGDFLSEFDGLKDKVANVFMSQTPEQIREITSKSKDYKVPNVENPETKKTSLEKPKKGEKIVIYLYRCLGIPLPTKEQLSPLKKLDITHLMFQLMGSFQFAKGKTEIIKGFMTKPSKFYKNDIAFFRNRLTGEITAGFVQKIGKGKITISTINDDGSKTTVEKYENQLLIAFQIPGNKTNGPIPTKTKSQD
ncbi:hypothetical protein J7J83_03565 [bacterium]|nr:hypothetical protein [bacterium]